MLNAHSDWPTRRASCTAAAAADAGASSVGVARRGSQRVLSPSAPASARLAIFLAPWSRSRCSLLTTADVASHECICAHGAPHPLMHHCSMTLQCCVTYLISSMVVGKGTATARGTTSKWRMASRAQKHTYTHTLSLPQSPPPPTLRNQYFICLCTRKEMPTFHERRRRRRRPKLLTSKTSPRVLAIS